MVGRHKGKLELSHMMIAKLISVAKSLEGIAHNTPVLTSTTLNKLVDANIFFKCENFQRVGAFKFRGAYNAISNLDKDKQRLGIITHSSGNHAQAVALTGKLLNIPTTIVMPENAPSVKVDATRSYGATIEFSKSSIKAREEKCQELIDLQGCTLIHPYDNQDVINGAASASYELLETTHDLNTLIVPVGGGGLISGTGLYSKLTKKIDRLIGAEPLKADDAYRSFYSGERVLSHTPDTIADGLRTTLSDLTFGYIQKFVDTIITAPEQQIIHSMKWIWERMKIIIEPSSAVPLACLFKMKDENLIKSGERIGIILTGGNIDVNVFFEHLANR